MATRANEKGTTHSERTFRVEQAFIKLGPGPHRLSAIADAAQLDDATTSRILASGIYKRTFVRRGRGLYDLGPSAAELGFSALSNDNLTGDEAEAVLRELRSATHGGLIFLYMRSPYAVAGRQCTLMEVGDSDLVELGMTPRDVLSVTRSLRTGASGRTILAYLSEEIQQAVLAKGIPPEAGPGVLTDDKELVESLAEVRDQGYALGRQECMAGWNSIAAPVFSGDNIMAAVLMLKSVKDMPEAPEPYIEAAVAAAARLTVLGGTWWPSEQ